MKIIFAPRKNISRPAPAEPDRGMGLEAHQLIGAHFKPKISDLKKLRRRCTLRKDTHESGMRRLAIRRGYPLNFQKNRMSDSRFDVPRLVVE